MVGGEVGPVDFQSQQGRFGADLLAGQGGPGKGAAALQRLDVGASRTVYTDEPA